MPVEVFVARQPIFDRTREIAAYELLFRSGPRNAFDPSVDPDVACSHVISNQLHVFKPDDVAGKRRAFINCTRKVIADRLIEMLPPDRVVVEVLETVKPDADVIQGLIALKQKGYTIALDDFEFSEELAPLVDLADIIKIDFLTHRGRQRAEAALLYKRRGLKILAEKVESAADVYEAMAMGYDYFQGFFFCRPEMIARRDVPAFKGNYLQLLNALYQPEVNFRQLSTIIRREPSLSVKLLRYLNSPAVGLRNKVESVQKGLVMLGEQNVRRWLTVLAHSSIGEDKPPALMLTALTRARFCELLGDSPALKGQKFLLFMAGLLSTVDALVGRPMEEIVAEIDPPDPLPAALIQREGPLARALDLVEAWEAARFDEVSRFASALKQPEKGLQSLYEEAVDWAETVYAT